MACPPVADGEFVKAEVLVFVGGASDSRNYWTKNAKITPERPATPEVIWLPGLIQAKSRGNRAVWGLAQGPHFKEKSRRSVSEFDPSEGWEQCVSF